MKAKWRKQKLVFLLIPGIFLLLICFSQSPALILFSLDNPLNPENELFDESDILFHNPDAGFHLI